MGLAADVKKIAFIIWLTNVYKRLQTFTRMIVEHVTSDNDLNDINVVYT